MYADFLGQGGKFFLKTDSTFLYEYTLETLGENSRYRITDHTADLYNSPLLAEHHGVKTHYEGIFTAKGHDIKYIKAEVL